MQRKKRNALGHGVVQADGKISKGADCWYFDVTVGTSSLRNHLQNGALDDLDLMNLGLAVSKLRGQYYDRCLGVSLEDLDPLVILAFVIMDIWALTLLSGSHFQFVGRYY